MQNRGFSDSSDDVEKLVAEQNEMTVIDESIPSPAEIQTDETIVLPEIISMPEYIRRHYEKELIRACINQIYDLTLCVVYEGKLFHDVPGLGPIDSGEEEMILTDGPTPLEWGEPKSFPFDRNVYSATIRPIDGAITWMDFYRLSDCCVEAELTVEVQLYFRYGSHGAFKKIAQKYYVTAWFEMEDGISAEFGDFKLRRPKKRSDIVKLDEYLVPVFKWDDMRKESDLANATFLYEDNADWQKALRFANGAQKATYEGYIAKVRERVNLQIRHYAYDCAVEMAVNPNAEKNKLDDELSACQNEYLHSNGKRADGSRRANSRQNEESFQKAVRDNEPDEVSEENLKMASGMFASIQDEEAAECARQCLALAEQARQKKIYIYAVKAYCRNRRRPIELERIAQEFLSISAYKDAAQQAQNCLNEAEAERSKLYSAALKTMQEAGESSNAWQRSVEALSTPELQNYRDVDALRQKAEARRDECIAAEKEKARRAEAKAKRLKIIASLTAVAVVAIILVVTNVIIPKGHYDNAIQFRANSQWEEAVEAFVEAGSYSDAETQISATYYAEGEAKRSAGEWEGALVAFENAGKYSDAAKQITETHYQHALSLMKSGDYNQAYALFKTLKGYADVDSLLANDEKLLAVAAHDAMFSIGNYVTFGTYPQTAESNDETPIEWLVLARDGDKALLLSRYGLDAKPYNESYTSITWEKCTLRTWLNSDFMYRAFTAAEQSAILLTNVDNSNSQGYSKWNTSGGNNTQDKVFLLSYAEANKYLGVTCDNSSNTKSRVDPTAYAIAQGAYTSDSNKTADGQAAGWWWLRSPGAGQSVAAHVYIDGSVYSADVSCKGVSVRPALWVNLESGFV